MKKIIIIAVLATFITSCSSHRGRVCGGPGGGRCVENTPKINSETPLSINS
jgi:hypothetical protein